MARRLEQDQSPEDQADELIRYNKRLQQQQQRDDLVGARVRFRNQALAHGIPSSWLPSVQQVKSMDDSTWNFHNQRINRLGFYGVDDMGRPLAKPAQSPLVPGTRAATSLIRRTGGPLDDLSINRFSTTQADARAIASKYSGESTIPESGSAGYYDSKGKFLGAAYDEAGKLIPMPAGATGIRGGAKPAKSSYGDVVGTKSPLDVIANPPKIEAAPLPSASTAYLGVPSGQEVPPGAAVRAGQAARQFVESTRGPLGGLESYRPSYQLPGTEKPIVDVPAVASSVIGAVRGFGSGFVSGNGGDKTAAGVTNATAAQFEKPTKENPVPVTPTTPVSDIDKSTESLGRFGMSDDEFNRRKFAFAGF